MVVYNMQRKDMSFTYYLIKRTKIISYPFEVQKISNKSFSSKIETLFLINRFL